MKRTGPCLRRSDGIPQPRLAPGDREHGNRDTERRGQFVAANVVAQNLSSKNPAITTQAILSGLQSGKSIGQTLQSLGLSSKEAHDAQRQADRDAKSAQRAAADSTKH